jgi:hypothetical protein
MALEPGRENCSYNEAVAIASIGAEYSFVRSLMLCNTGKEKFPVLLVEMQRGHLTEFSSSDNVTDIIKYEREPIPTT